MNKHTIKQAREGKPDFWVSKKSGLIPSLVLVAVVVILFFVPGTPESLKDIQTGVRLDFEAQKSNLTPTAPNQKGVFEDRTLQSGLTSSHHQRSKRISALNESLGAGACVLDYDNDGWMDLFIIGGSGSTRFYGKQQWWYNKTGNRLYRNVGGGQFEDVTESAGLTEIDWGMGCAAADLDNDGDTDLYLTNYGPNRLYENLGNGTYKDVTTNSAVAGLNDTWSTTAAIADIDGDGLLDIYVTNYLRYKKGMYTLESEAGFDAALPRDLQADLFDSQPNILLKNRGNLQFDDVTKRYGVANSEGRSLSALWLDINGDHRPDLYVTNDTGLPDKVYLNSGEKGFSEIGDILNISDPTSTTSIAVGDLNNDGNNDILLGSHAGAVTRLLLNPGQPHDKPLLLPFTEEGRDRLENIESTNVAHNWGVGLYDFNLDGWLDIFLANGLTSPDPDTHAQLATGQINQLWLNTGVGKFRQSISAVNSPLHDALPSRGTVFADFDNDGDTDIFINNNNELGQLLINKLETQSSWIGVKLIGNNVNRDGVGTVVKLISDGQLQQRKAGEQYGFLSSSDPRMVFGFNKGSKNTSLEITWPDGSVDQISQPPQNTYTVIRQGDNTYRSSATKTSTEPGSTLLLPEGENNTKFLRPYLNILIAEQSPLLKIEIEIALRDPAIEVRQLARKFIKHLPPQQQPPLLLTLLEDKSIELRKIALDLLIKTEQESTFRWLLRQFNNVDPDMRLIVTEGFYDYFRKEEAMVIHKYQAIPHLIQRLDDASEDVKLAAIKALGASEHYRATGPLIELLSVQSEKIRGASARALGHVRERFVIKALNSALETESSPSVMANILISLKRLNSPDVDERLKTFMTSEKTGANEKTALLRHLFKDDDNSTVFSPTELATLVTKLLQNSTEYIAANLDSLAVLNTTSSSPIFIKYLKNKNLAVQQSACFGLAKINLKKFLSSHIKTCSSLIKENPTRFFKDVAGNVSKGRSKLDFQQVKKLLPELQASLLAEQHALFSIESMPSNWLFKIASMEDAPTKNRVKALGTLIHRIDAPTDISEQLVFHNDMALQKLAINYWGEHGIKGKSPKFIITRFNQLLETKNIAGVVDAIAGTVVKMPANITAPLLQQWLMDSTKKIEIRQSLLTAISKNSRHLETVLELARRRHEAFSLDAILALGLYEDKRASNYLHHVYQNADETRQARVAAALALYPENASSIIPFLTGTL